MLKFSTPTKVTVKQEIIPISAEKRKTILTEAKKKDDAMLREILLKIAVFPYTLPNDFDQKFLALQSTYQLCEDEANLKPILLQALETYIDSKGLGLFKKYINKKKIEAVLHTSLLTFISDHLKLNLNEPYIELTVNQGKIYWRIMQNNVIRYIRDAWNDKEFFTKNTQITRLTWEQFRKFKDAGKRGGSVEITKERFSNYFCNKIKIDKTKKKEVKQQAEKIWEMLKSGHILDKNNRLSHAWRIKSNQSVSFEGNKFKGYFSFDKIVEAFASITSNNDFKEDFTEYYPDAYSYRSERSPKTWQSTGRVINRDGKSDEHATQCWDVSIYSDLNSHAANDDGLDHDHIPSAGAIRKHRKQWKKDVYEYEENYEGENDKLVELATAEKADHWWTIAIPHELHKKGLTFAESANVQEALVETPLYDEVIFYLSILEKELSSSDYLKALGAFRFLYHCQIKNPTEILKGEYDRSWISWHFFQDDNRRNKLDTLFNEKLISFQLKG